MKKILFLCDCHYYRLALKNILEKEKGCKVEFISLESLKDRDCGNDTVLIHLTQGNHLAIFRIYEKRQLNLSSNSIIITDKRLITQFSRIFDKRVQFIDELSILDKHSDHEVFEKDIDVRDGISEINVKINSLSSAEFLVLSMLMAGLSPTTIALKTKRSIKTISSHKINALRKLGLDNTAHSMLKLFSSHYGVIR